MRQRESADPTVIATSPGDAVLHAACMATLQAMETESMARELGVRLDVMQVASGLQRRCRNHRPAATGESETFRRFCCASSETSAPKVFCFGNR